MNREAHVRFCERLGVQLPRPTYHGIGVWLAARRLNAGKFIWPADGSTLQLSRIQFDALVLGLPWHRLGEAGIIRVI